MVRKFLEFVQLIPHRAMYFSLGEKGHFIARCSERYPFEEFKETIDKHPEYATFVHKSKNLPHRTVLAQCLAAGFEEHALYLIEKGANVNLLSSHYDEYPIILAARKGLISIVKEMIKRGVDLNVMNSHGQNCLMECFNYSVPKFVELVELLKKHDFNFNHTDLEQSNILFYMARKQYPTEFDEDCIKVILETNINLAHTNKVGEDILEYNKKHHGSVEFFSFMEKYLLEKSISQQNNHEKKSKKQKI